MKFRKDFVTNSSSSSYICDICGASESGWDLALSECDMCECVNGHIFCTDHAIISRKDIIKTILEQEWNNETEEELNDYSDNDLLYHEGYSDNGYEVPESGCPICQFIEYSQYDLATYLLKEYKIPRDEVFAEIKKVNKRRKKLYDSEYVTFVCQKFNLQPAEIVTSWKEKFGTYAKFKEFIRVKD